ncbi:MAG: hypothetical protein IPJ40_06155 [Saprospirales bacterium]|nr:hypothetical protein [Saprospirales bacterium]
MKISNDFYGQVNITTNVLMEDGSKKNGIEIIPGEKATSRVYAEYPISEMPKNPVFRHTWVSGICQIAKVRSLSRFKVQQ